MKRLTRIVPPRVTVAIGRREPSLSRTSNVTGEGWMERSKLTGSTIPQKWSCLSHFGRIETDLDPIH